MGKLRRLGVFIELWANKQRAEPCLVTLRMDTARKDNQPISLSSEEEDKDRGPVSEELVNLECGMSQGDLDNIAKYFKQAIISQMDEEEEPKAGESGEKEEDSPQEGSCQNVRVDTSQNDDLQTPKFSFLHKLIEYPEEGLNIDQNISKDKPQDEAMNPQSQSPAPNQNPVYKPFLSMTGLTLPERRIESAPSKFQLLTLNSKPTSIDCSRIQRMPLFGIDHSAQFFQEHPILSVRMKVEQALARYYCENQGIHILCFSQGLYINEELKLTGAQLEEITIIVFLTTFRKMEEFITEKCSKNIVQIEKIEVRAVYPLLLNAKMNLNEEQFQTLIKLMRISFGMPAQVKQKEAQGLYTFLLAVILSSKETEAPQFDYGDAQTSEQFKWTQEKAQMFCQLYLKNKSVVGMHQEINQQLGSSLSPSELRVELQKIVRLMLKKIEGQFIKYDKLRLHPVFLTQELYRMAARDPKGLALRLALLEVYVTGHIVIEDVRQIIVLLDQLMHEKRKSHVEEQKNGKILEAGTGTGNVPRTSRARNSQQLSEPSPEPESSSTPEKPNYAPSQNQQKKRSNPQAPASNRQLSLMQTFERYSDKQPAPTKALKLSSDRYSLRHKETPRQSELNRKVSNRPSFSQKLK